MRVPGWVAVVDELSRSILGEAVSPANPYLWKGGLLLNPHLAASLQPSST